MPKAKTVIELEYNLPELTYAEGEDPNEVLLKWEVEFLKKVVQEQFLQKGKGSIKITVDIANKHGEWGRKK